MISVTITANHKITQRLLLAQHKGRCDSTEKSHGYAPLFTTLEAQRDAAGDRAADAAVDADRLDRDADALRARAAPYAL